MLKRVTILTLITATVLLTYHVAFAYPVNCNTQYQLCVGSCWGWFEKSMCTPSAQCNWADRCFFTCFMQANPGCYPTGFCCDE
jgi:hypothetical protein